MSVPARMRRRAFLGGALRAAGAALAAGTAAGCAAQRAAPRNRAGGCGPGSQPRQLRGTWIASFNNLDWPSRPGLPAGQQQAELAGLLDLAKRLRLNAVMLQVRPTADALYPSRVEPWSKWLTGSRGRPPGYDPLAFAVSAAHDRGLELHAWFNPFRVSEQPDRRALAATHPARQHPGWVVEYAGELWYDPGNPAVRALAVHVIEDVARRYGVDGIHLDDYFYPYPVAGHAFPDSATFRRYGEGFTTRASWRRHNVNLLIADITRAVRRVAPRAMFGVSPFGIWRNAATDPAGSMTTGLQAYDDLYADARAWLRGGWLDYIAPQLYWEISDPAAPYPELVRWWSRAVTGSGTQLYIGQAAYQAGVWRDPAELVRHLAVDGAHPEVTGELFFHARSLASGGLAARLAGGAFAAPAGIPVPRRLQRRPGPAQAGGWSPRAGGWSPRAGGCPPP